MTSRQRLLAIFAAINLVILVAGWMTLISPQRHDAAAATARQQVVAGQLDVLNTAAAQGPGKQPTIHTADLYRVGTALPSQLDTPDLLLELDALAKASSVKILNLSPQATVAASTDYTIQPINLSLNGSYFHLTHFLRSLRLLVSKHHGRLIANGPLFAVTAVSLAPGASADKTGKGEVATVGMAAYYYGMVGGAAPAPTDTTTTETTGG